ncbi:MAG: HAD-IIIC family phosphatase [Acidobacteriota bacterium]|nr:HAD-IIIC family phosphatase [Acidobacteriota bacterium]
MKFTQALKAVQGVAPDSQRYDVLLGCGFTSLHLQTFLAAHLVQRVPGRRPHIRTGLYGDVAGTLESVRSNDQFDAIAVALEWFDLDPRLGYRSAGAWNSVSDLLASARTMLARIGAAIERLPSGIPVAISLPTLPLPPVFSPAGWQASQAELELQKVVLNFAASASVRRACGIVNPVSMARKSAPADRYDFKSDLSAGLPYTLAHADAVGEALAQLLAPPAPKKGIITDLDDTLWSGIVGEVGPENVSWDLAGHAQLHGLYQKLLSTLAGEGVLVAIASKNDPAVASRALERNDLLLRRQEIFPQAISWNSKSGAVSRILETWNVGADSVVFIDDSPMELAEVSSAHPSVECILFPKADPAAGYTLLHRLRDLCGKPRVSEEDALRLESIRQGAAFRDAESGGIAPEEFLRQAGAVVTFDFDGVAEDARALELVNKTNQFNLNGRRIAENDWQARLSRASAVAATIAYQDRFGPLGKISVLQGEKQGNVLVLETWVLSCRAFARRIEFQCLKTLFDRYDIQVIELAFVPTSKNGPTRDLLSALGLKTASSGEERPALSRRQFDEFCPALCHEVKVAGLMTSIGEGNSKTTWTL